MSEIEVWEDEDGGVLNVEGTHDVDRARHEAERYARALGLNIEGPPYGLDLQAPPKKLWWSVPVLDPDSEDYLYPEVPEGTAGARAMTTWWP